MFYERFIDVHGRLTTSTTVRAMRCHYKRIFICFYFSSILLGTFLIFFSYRCAKPPTVERVVDKDHYFYAHLPDDDNFWLNNTLFWTTDFSRVDQRNLQHEEVNNLNGQQLVAEQKLNFDRFEHYLTWRRSRQQFGRDLNRIFLKISEEKGLSFFVDCYQSQNARRRWITPRNSTGKHQKDLSSWTAFYDNIGKCDLYGSNDESDRILDDLFNDMRVMPFADVRNMPRGTQVKLELTFQNGYKAVMKPMRFGRDYETHPNHFYFSDFERHNAEIATFHLDKILGFRRTLPTVGRLVNLTTIEPVAEGNLSRLFFLSPAKNLCFVGTCKYYCDTTHAICGKPFMVEASLQVFLPHEDFMAASRLKSPFARTYSKKRQQAAWQMDEGFCENSLKNSSVAPFLLDIVDAAILDFLTGNQDRHHFEFVELYGRERYFIHIDNGRAFGRSKVDDLDILAPLTQCCLIRPSTLAHLLKYFDRPCSLARTLNLSMSADPLAPLLADKHLVAVERRLEKILMAIHKCIFLQNNADYKKVVVKSFKPH